MSGADHEIELKFACAPQDLAAVLAAAPAGDDETRELISVYFDTPDLALRKAGASLRVREHKGRRVQTLKRGQGLVREEHEAAIEGLAPDPTLAPLPSLLPHGATLKPAFHVRVSRRQRTLRYRGARIELALDQGELAGGDRLSPICEVELELKSGPTSALFALARALSLAVPLYLTFDSKAARGHALVAGDSPAARKGERIALASEATAGEALQAVARAALAQIAANAAAVRAEAGAEAVHQLRVGARRLRSALTTFKPLLDGDPGVGPVKAELKWLSHTLDRARNLDVFADETLAAAEEAKAPPPGLGALRATVEAARLAAWTQAAETAGGERFRALMIDTAAWIETGAWRNGGRASEPAKAFARHALKRRLKRLETRGRRLERDDAARHRLRIEAKKLRYAAEAFASRFGQRRAGRFGRRLEALQETLGRLNDLVTAEPLLASLSLAPDAAFAAGELVGLKAAGKDRLVAKAAHDLERLLAADPFWD